MSIKKTSHPVKKEEKKSNDIYPFDLMKLLGLRPKKKDERYKKYASLNRRIIAASIDSMLASYILEPITIWYLKTFSYLHEVDIQALNEALADEQRAFSRLMRLLIESGRIQEYAIEIVLYMLVSGICWKLWSATPGKLLLRIKVVDAKTDKPLSDRQIILRLLGYIPSCGFFFLGIFWVGFNKRHQGWHDLIADTAVIVDKKPKKIVDTGTEEYLEKSVEISAAAN